jgi:hypothetical protein
MKKQFYNSVLLAMIFCLPIISLNAQVGTPISTYEELNTLIRADLTASYYLTNDIVIPEETEWIPFGKDASGVFQTNFTGTFDGRGHSIKNLKITAGGDFTGLFAKIADGSVKNLGLENVDITGTLATGGLTGTIFGTKTTYTPSVVIENVFVTGSVKGTTEVGGISGRNNSNMINTIKNCYVNATIEATNPTGAWAGGIVGCSATGRRLVVQQVYVAGIVKTTSTDPLNFAGGILGYVNNPNTATIIRIDSSVVALTQLAGGTNGIIMNRGILAGTTTLNDNYARNDLGITETTDGTLVAPSVVLSKNLYETTLGWDFMNLWEMEDGVSYPTLSWSYLTTGVNQSNDKQNWSIQSSNKGITVSSNENLSLSVLEITGRLIYNANVSGLVNIPLNKGIYIVKAIGGGNESSRKVIVY